MRNYLNYFRLLLVALLFTTSAGSLFADKETETEGTSFWFAIPKANHAFSETPRGSETGTSEELFITSKVNTTVRIYDHNKNYLESHQVMANSAKVVPVLANSQNTEGEVLKTNKSFYVESDDPISLVVYISWKWTGEAYRIIPNDWLGNDYYTLNLYQDYCRMASYSNPNEAMQDHPSQILILATEDQTEVTYYPTAPTDKVKAGESKTIIMNEGDTYLILGKINQFMRHFDETDLTGTRIVADKKIAVFSGHTKGSFPKFAPTYYGGIKADFLRNMLFDSMWPTSMLGKYYTTVPLMYSNGYNGREMQGLIGDERGDLIRFVATQDNTNIFEMQANGTWGSKPLNSQPLKKGKFFQFTNRETPGHFKSNYPVLVGQYGKGWFWWTNGVIHTKEENSSDDKEDEILNPSRCGQGMMYAVTPDEQWANYAGFNAVPVVNNHYSLIFKTGEEEFISLDGKNVKDNWGAKIKKIPGSPYSYLRDVVVKGGHFAQSSKQNVLFSLYVYGNMDGYKDGFAYGYPTTVNYYAPCNDSIVIESTPSCNIINGTINVIDLQVDTSCAAIQSVKTISKENAKLNSTFTPGKATGTFTITFTDKTLDGKIKISILTKSGTTLTKEFTYSPELVSATPDQLVYSKLETNQPEFKEITVSNPSTKVPLMIKKLYLKNSNPAFTLQYTPLENIAIEATKNIKFQVKALMTDPDITFATDEIWADLECYTTRLATVTVTSGMPIVHIDSAHFGTVPAGKPVPAKEVHFWNTGSNPAYITGYTMLDGSSDKFRFDDAESGTGKQLKLASPSNPIVLQPNEPITFKVYYEPGTDKNDMGVVHEARLELLRTNATEANFISLWTGKASNADISITSHNYGTQRVIDAWAVANGINEYDGTIEVSNGGNDILTDVEIKMYNKGTNDDYNGDNSVMNFVANANDLKDLKTNGLAAGATKIVHYTFIPKDQKDYSCELIASGNFSGIPKQSERGVLEGKGKQPHVSTVDMDFGRIDLNTNTKTVTKLIPVYATRNAALAYDMELTITKLEIIDNADGKFDFDYKYTTPDFDPKAKRTLKIGDTLFVPIIFDPKDPKDEGNGYTAKLEVACDAPATAVDVKISNLNGKAFKSAVTPSPLAYPATFKTTIASGKSVSLTNNGSVSIFINKAINLSLRDKVAGSMDKNAFILKSMQLSNDLANNIALDASIIEIPKNVSLIVNYDFAPMRVGNYEAELVYTYVEDKITNTQEFTSTSVLEGIGKEYFAECSIPTGYKAKPGDLISYSKDGGNIAFAEFRLYPAQNEKPLVEANITTFTAGFKFGDMIKDSKGKHFFPQLNADRKVDILSDRTMTEGWKVDEVKIMNNDSLVVTMSSLNGQPLSKSNDDVLFRFKMLGYLSTPGSIIEFIPAFTPGSAAKGYVSTNPNSGNGEILPVCIDSTRIIQFSGLDNASRINPSQVSNDALIDYTVAIDCPVVIEVFNYEGSKVSTLIDSEYKKAGQYQVKFDANKLGLPSGSYSYRIQMGPYTDVKQFVITR